MAQSGPGAPIGNQNGRKGKVWSDAIRRAIREKGHGEDFEAKVASIAAQLVDAALIGDMQALKEIGDRLDGKSPQGVELSGPDGDAITLRAVDWNIVKPID